MKASAPGKVLWAGEYAVLEGWPGVVTAVDRRVVAETVDADEELSPFLEALRVELGDAVRRIRVDSSALALGARKLGLGSSAAAVVAAAAVATGSTDVQAVAHRAHASAQAARGARGSGSDIAAVVHGGVVRVIRTSDDDDAPLAATPLPAPPPFVLLWTGTPADTPALVARTRGLRDRDPGGYTDAMRELGMCAESLAVALAARDTPGVIAAISDGAGALAALADRAGAPLVPPGFGSIAALADRWGGAAKPTGAGGGDIVLAVFPDPEAAAAFRTTASRQRMIPIAAGVDPHGVLLAKNPG